MILSITGNSSVSTNLEPTTQPLVAMTSSLPITTITNAPVPNNATLEEGNCKIIFCSSSRKIKRMKDI